MNFEGGSPEALALVHRAGRNTEKFKGAYRCVNCHGQFFFSPITTQSPDFYFWTWLTKTYLHSIGTCRFNRLPYLAAPRHPREILQFFLQRFSDVWLSLEAGWMPAPLFTLQRNQRKCCECRISQLKSQLVNLREPTLLRSTFYSLRLPANRVIKLSSLKPCLSFISVMTRHHDSLTGNPSLTSVEHAEGSIFVHHHCRYCSFTFQFHSKKIISAHIKSASLSPSPARRTAQLNRPGSARLCSAQTRWGGRASERPQSQRRHVNFQVKGAAPFSSRRRLWNIQCAADVHE